MTLRDDIDANLTSFRPALSPPASDWAQEAGNLPLTYPRQLRAIPRRSWPPRRTMKASIRSCAASTSGMTRFGTKQSFAGPAWNDAFRREQSFAELSASWSLRTKPGPVTDWQLLVTGLRRQMQSEWWIVFLIPEMAPFAPRHRRARRRLETRGLASVQRERLACRTVRSAQTPRAIPNA